MNSHCVLRIEYRVRDIINNVLNKVEEKNRRKGKY